MKKIVLLFSLCLMATIGGAQVIFYVNAPSPNEGNYDFTYAEPTGAAPWGVPDLTDPINSVEDTMVLITDGTGDTNPEGCSDYVDANIDGKIAVLYRGDCEFGVKARNAQDNGAVGVIIINNLAGAAVAMGAGAEGGGVTIPVVMISDVDGALLRTEIEAGATTVFIGSKNGLYSNDMGFSQADLLRAERFGNLQQLSQDETEFSVELGSWVRNYGTNDQTGVQLNCTITLGASVLYDETSDPVAVEAGDSVFVGLDPFEQASYANGYYNVVYTVTSDAADEADFDNTQEADFAMGEDYFSMARLDETTMEPINMINQFNGSTDNLYSCLFFEDENASRLGMRGMNFSAGTSQNPDASSIDGQLVEAVVYRWNDPWVDLNDGDFAISALDIVTTQEYVYTADAQGENIYIPFEEPFLMEDGQRYLACVQMYGNIIYPGYDTKIDYNWNVEEYAMPTSPIYSSGNWFALGFGTDLNPSISVHMFDAGEVGLVELPKVDLTAFPNPAEATVHIPMEMKEGNIALTILDVNGKVVSSQNTVMNGPRLDVDVTTLPSGLYVINLQFADGTIGTVNVAVTR